MPRPPIWLFMGVVTSLTNRVIAEFEDDLVRAHSLQK